MVVGIGVDGMLTEVYGRVKKNNFQERESEREFFADFPQQKEILNIRDFQTVGIHAKAKHNRRHSVYTRKTDGAFDFEVSMIDVVNLC